MRSKPSSLTLVAGVALALMLAGSLSGTALAITEQTAAAAPGGLGASIASIAEGQDQTGAKVVDDPASVADSGGCNPYSGYWGDGPTSSGSVVCPVGPDPGVTSKQSRWDNWCADFAAWVWQQAGVSFTYSWGANDIDGAARSFYYWGLANGTWHAVGTGYTPQQGDVAVYGPSGADASHVGIYVSGSASSPNVVNGNWSLDDSWTPTNYAVWYKIGEPNTGIAGDVLDGYVSPIVSTTAPAAPTSVSASPLNDGEATVSWQPGSNGGSAISYYTVTSSPVAVSLSYDPTYNSVVLGGLTTGVAYTFTVTASNAVGTSGPSAPSNAVIPYTYPDPPTIGYAVPGNASATVSFGAPASDGWSPVTSYVVTAYDTSNSANGGQTATGTSGPITITGLTNGDRYGFFAQAVNAGGTSASSPDSQLVTPLGSADSPADVYIADTGNNRVVEVPVGGGAQTTVGSGFRAPEGVAVDAQGDVFVADTGNNRVVEVGGGAQTTLATGLGQVTGLAVDSNENVWIADAATGQIEVIIESTSAGAQPWVSVSTPGGIAVDSAGDLFIPEVANDQVVVQPWSGSQSFAIGGGLNSEIGVAVRSAPPAPTDVSVVAGDASATVSFQAPSVIGFSPVTSYEAGCTDVSGTSSTHFASGSSSPITVDDLTNGDQYSCEVAAINAVGAGPWEEPSSYHGELVTPTATTSPSMNLFVSDYYGGRVLETPAGSSTPIAVGTADKPEGLAVDPQGNTYVPEPTDNLVVKIPADGSADTSVGTGLVEPLAVALDAAGDVFIADADGVVEVPANGSAQKVVISDSGIEGLAVDSAGNVFASDEIKEEILEEPSAGGPLVTIATGVLTGSLAVDSKDDVFYASPMNNRVVEIAAGTGTETDIGSGLALPQGVAVDTTGNVYIADTFNNRVLEVPATGGPEFTIGSGIVEPTYIAVQKPVVPGTPTGIGLTANSGADTITLTWGPPTSYGSSPVTGYVVSESGSSGAPTVLPASARSEVFQYVPVGEPVTFSVQAVNLAGMSLPASGTTTLLPPTRQTISFTALSSGSVGRSATLSATGGASRNPVVFSVDPSSQTGVCNVSGTNGTTVDYTGAGNCVLDANQAGNANYGPAAQVQQTVQVGPGSQTILFTAPSPGSVGGSTTLSATGGASGDPVVFSADPSSQTGVCNVSGTNGTTVDYTGVGNCVLDANQAGNANYGPAARVQQTVQVGPGSQTISFTAPSSGSVGGSATLSATGGASGNPVVFSVDPSSQTRECNVSGTNGTTVDYTGVGNCVLDANQASDASQAGPATYLAAPEVAATITVGQGSQTISFTSPVSGTVDGSASLSATGGASGNPLIFSVSGSSGAGVCNVTGVNGTTVKYATPGNCIIDANQAGNADYEAAPEVSQTISVREGAPPGGGSGGGLPPAPVTVTLTQGSPTSAIVAYGSGYVGHGLTLTNSTGIVSYTEATSTDSADVVISLTGAISAAASVAAGTYTVGGEDSDTNGDTGSWTFSLIVIKASQAITFTAAPTGTLNVSALLSPKSSSGLKVTLSIDPTTTNGACSISDDTVNYLHSGRCVIDANQAGDADYLAAIEVKLIITVGKAITTVTLRMSATKVTYGDEQVEQVSVTVSRRYSGSMPSGTVTIKASATTLCVVKLSSGKGWWTMSAKKLKVGTYRFVATYNGDKNFKASTSVKVTLTVAKS